MEDKVLSFWMFVVFPILVGATAMAFEKICYRYVMKNGIVSPLRFLILKFSLVVALFMAIYISLWGFTIPNLLPGFWNAVIIGTLAGTIIHFCNAKAASLDKGEVSLTAPLQAMTPGLITGLALLLGEYPGKAGVFGVFLMACGSYILLFEKSPERWYDYIGPIKRLRLLLNLSRLSEGERNKTIVVSLALTSACMGTIGLLCDGLYTRRGIDVQGLTLGSMAYAAILVFNFAFWYTIFPDRKPIAQYANGGRPIRFENKYLLILLVIGILWVVHIYTIWPAFNKTYVAYAGTLKRFSILVSVVFGSIIFKEQDFKKRLVAAFLVVIGAYFISLDNLPLRIATRIEGWGF